MSKSKKKNMKNPKKCKIKNHVLPIKPTQHVNFEERSYNIIFQRFIQPAVDFPVLIKKLYTKFRLLKY